MDPGPDVVDGPSEGHYGLVTEHVGIPGKSDFPWHLYLAPSPHAAPSAELRSLASKLEEFASALRTVLKKRWTEESELRAYFDELVSVGQLGLVGARRNPAAARDALRSLELRILSSAGPGFRRCYSGKLGRAAVFASVVVVMVVSLSHQIPSTWLGGDLRDVAGVFAKFHWVLLGAFTAMWLSFVSRHGEIAISELANPSHDIVHPRIRVVYVALFAALFVVLLSSGAFSASIGPLSVADLQTSWRAATLWGAGCGFSERLFTNAIVRRLSAMTGVSDFAR